MTKVRSYLVDAGLKVSRWDGAGAVAASLLQREGVKARKSFDSRRVDSTPKAVQDAAQYAFAGGRIELLRYGHHAGPIYHYDINSAYPHALRTVPCLACGRWRHRDYTRRAYSPKSSLHAFSLLRVRWHYSTGARLYPFFYRAPDGRILYPHAGESWCWLPEYRAAVDMGMPLLLAHSNRAEHQRVRPVPPVREGGLSETPDRAARLTVLESWEYQPGCAHQPFDFIPRLFEQRQAWKRDGRGAEKMLKLGLNSLYGKCAQHVGGDGDTPPAWHQLEWAGFTTSSTRAALYRAAMQAPHDVVFMATDGIYSTAPLDLPLGKGLGQWDYQEHTGLTAVQSGVYWVDHGEDIKAYHRGFDGGSIDRQKVLRAWTRGRSSVIARSTRFVGMGQALAGESRFKLWRQWVQSPRELQLTPAGTKRMDDLTTRPRPAAGLVATVPYDPALEDLPLLSTPAALPWRTLPGVLPLPEAVDDSEDAIL